MIRNWISGLVFFLILCCAQTHPVNAEDSANSHRVRLSLQEFVKDQNRVRSLRRGIQVMKQRNSAPKDSAEYRTSWEYWASIHGYPGADSMWGTIEQIKQKAIDRYPDDAPLYTGFFAGINDIDKPTKPKDIADKTWDTCEHGTEHFLTWHRMYLYFFEQVLRAASGDPNLTLPYWDYTNITVEPSSPVNAASTAQPAQPPAPPYALPIEFAVPTLDKDGKIPNPLYDKHRTTDFGFSVQLDPRLTNVDKTLLIDNFLEFQKTLDRSIHGHIHCTVGNGCLAPYMGIVAFSANDPIFWIHHANIDRLWDCWTKLHPKGNNLPVSDAKWMGKEFFFVDEKGNLTSMKVSELFDPKGRIDYTYDNTSDCLREIPPATKVVQEMAGEHTVQRAKRAEDVHINNADQDVSLSGTKMNEAFGPNVLSPTKATLTLEGVQVTKEPGASMLVLLRSADREALVGALNFFNVFEPGTHGDLSEARDYSFDVTAQLEELSAKGATADAVHVAFVASSGLTGNNVTPNKQRYESAGITIRRITLQIEGKQKVPVDLQ